DEGVPAALNRQALDCAARNAQGRNAARGACQGYIARDAVLTDEQLSPGTDGDSHRLAAAEQIDEARASYGRSPRDAARKDILEGGSRAARQGDARGDGARV